VGQDQGDGHRGGDPDRGGEPNAHGTYSTSIGRQRTRAPADYASLH
jgi:hypothetical protein